MAHRALSYALLFCLTACGTTIIVAEDDGEGGSTSNSTGSVAPPNPVGGSGPGQGGNGPGPGPGPGQGGNGPGPGPGQGGNGPGPGPGPGVGGSSGCYDESLAVAAPALPAVAGQGVCTPQAIDDFIGACLADGASQATCNTFTDMNPACSACIGVPMSGMTQPVLLLTAGFIAFNITSCESLAQGKPQCAIEATNLNYCVLNTCSLCSDFEFETCLGQAQSGLCGESFPVSDMCDSVFGDIPSPQCSSDDVFQLIVNMATFMCGP